MSTLDDSSDTAQAAKNADNLINNITNQNVNHTNSLSIDNSGVVYISRIPPKMTASKLRSLLAIFGKINRIYLMPTKYSKKVNRISKNKPKYDLFSHGWVEFYDKNDAKAAANQLNSNIIGGKKRNNKWHDDIWTIKYLPTFKWYHLQEHLRSNKERDKADIQQRIISMKQENSHYLEQLESEKKIIKIGEKKIKSNKNFTFGVKPTGTLKPTNNVVSSKLLQTIAL